MELRKRKVVDDWQSAFHSLQSPFSEAITSQLLNRCVRVEELPEPTTSEGVGRNYILSSRRTITVLSPEQKSELTGSIGRVFVGERIKIPMGSCNVKKNDGTCFKKTSKTTFADIHKASAYTPLIVCCCENFEKLLRYPCRIIPEDKSPTDVLSFGATYSPLHIDIGGTSRDQIIVNDGSYKIHIIAKSKDQRFQTEMADKIVSWTQHDGSVDIFTEINWIIEHKHDFQFLFQSPFEQIRHCGANYHCVLTLTTENQGITLSVGYLQGHPEGTMSYLKSEPVKGYQKGGSIVPLKTEKQAKVRNL